MDYIEHGEVGLTFIVANEAFHPHISGELQSHVIHHKLHVAESFATSNLTNYIAYSFHTFYNFYAK
jgi:hypothetical protein